MSNFWSDLRLHWKSNLSGLLTLTLITTGYLATLPAIYSHPKTLSIVGGIQGLAKLYVAYVTKDAGIVMATTPSNPVPHVEPAHEVPDSPAATPIPASKPTTPEVKQ
jgi:hypothetical protein